MFFLVVFFAFPGHPTRQKTVPRQNRHQRSPANPLATPPQVPRSPLKKSNSRPEPLKISPPEPPHGEGPLGDLFGSIHFLNRACFLSRGMAWVCPKKKNKEKKIRALRVVARLSSSESVFRVYCDVFVGVSRGNTIRGNRTERF